MPFKKREKHHIFEHRLLLTYRPSKPPPTTPEHRYHPLSDTPDPLMAPPEAFLRRQNFLPRFGTWAISVGEVFRFLRTVDIYFQGFWCLTMPRGVGGCILDRGQGPPDPFSSEKRYF